MTLEKCKDWFIIIETNEDCDWHGFIMFIKRLNLNHYTTLDLAILQYIARYIHVVVARNIIALYVVPPHQGNGELLCDRSEEV